MPIGVCAIGEALIGGPAIGRRETVPAPFLASTAHPLGLELAIQLEEQRLTLGR